MPPLGQETTLEDQRRSSTIPRLFSQVKNGYSMLAPIPTPVRRVSLVVVRVETTRLFTFGCTTSYWHLLFRSMLTFEQETTFRRSMTIFYDTVPFLPSGELIFDDSPNAITCTPRTVRDIHILTL